MVFDFGVTSPHVQHDTDNQQHQQHSIKVTCHVLPHVLFDYGQRIIFFYIFWTSYTNTNMIYRAMMTLSVFSDVMVSLSQPNYHNDNSTRLYPLVGTTTVYFECGYAYGTAQLFCFTFTVATNCVYWLWTDKSPPLAQFDYHMRHFQRSEEHKPRMWSLPVSFLFWRVNNYLYGDAPYVIFWTVPHGDTPYQKVVPHGALLWCPHESYHGFRSILVRHKYPNGCFALHFNFVFDFSFTSFSFQVNKK